MTTPDRLLQLSSLALDCEHTAATWFYPEAHRFVSWLAGVGNLTLQQSAATIAVLSPRNTWTGNQHDAVALVLGSDCNFGRTNGAGYSAMLRDVNRAKSIINGGSINDHLRGVKVNAFYRNLINPTTDVGLPIDRHLTRAVYGHDIDDATVTKIVRTNYQRIEDLISTIAISQGYRPIVFANLLWYVVRRLSSDRGQHSLTTRQLDWRPIYPGGDYSLPPKARQSPKLTLLPGCSYRPWLLEQFKHPRQGNETIDRRGRVRVNLGVGHRFANKGRFQYRSRLVVTYALQDNYLAYDVDHIDRDRSNDEISNLRLLDHDEHARLHSMNKHRSKGAFVKVSRIN